MSFRLRGRFGMRRRCTGSRPSRPSPTFNRTTVVCIQCLEPFETVTEQDGLPVNVVACPVCKTVFNRETKKILNQPTEKSDG